MRIPPNTRTHCHLDPTKRKTWPPANQAKNYPNKIRQAFKDLTKFGADGNISLKEAAKLRKDGLDGQAIRDAIRATKPTVPPYAKFVRKPMGSISKAEAKTIIVDDLKRDYRRQLKTKSRPTPVQTPVTDLPGHPGIKVRGGAFKY